MCMKPKQTVGSKLLVPDSLGAYCDSVYWLYDIRQVIQPSVCLCTHANICKMEINNNYSSSILWRLNKILARHTAHNNICHDYEHLCDCTKFYSQFKPSRVRFKHMPKGHLAGSSGRVWDTWPQGHEFKLHDGHGDYLKTNQKNYICPRQALYTIQTHIKKKKSIKKYFSNWRALNQMLGKQWWLQFILIQLVTIQI